MKKLLPILLLTGLLCGCTHQYVMKLHNGRQITTASKPQLRGSTYYFKDAQGKENAIAQSRVNEIMPASMAAESNKFTPQAPHKKKWYWPF